MPQGYFVLTDLSGYTAFLTRSELEHANEILQTLFQVQLDLIQPPFVLSGFRGDAIFMYIPEGSFVQPQSVLEALENLYIAFSTARDKMQIQTTCPCRACREISLLDLKMVVHYGSYLVQQIGGREELLGADVIVPHRMLKNSVTEQTGIVSYALFTEAAAEPLQLREFVETLYEYVDTYEHIGRVNMIVFDLRTLWERERARRSKTIGADEAWVKFAAEIKAPPSLVWDYMITPRLKIQMTGLRFMKRTDELGGRVRAGSRYHCAHGAAEFTYEIVDWKPFEYFTILQTDSVSHLEYFETYYFAATEGGTRFTSCVSKPEGNVPPGVQAMFQALWDEAYGGIQAFIEQETTS